MLRHAVVLFLSMAALSIFGSGAAQAVSPCMVANCGIYNSEALEVQHASLRGRLIAIQGITRLARDSQMRLAVSLAVAPKKTVARLDFDAHEGEFTAKLRVPKRDRDKHLVLALTAVAPAGSSLKNYTIKFTLKPT